jgi:hypothetical protein
LGRVVFRAEVALTLQFAVQLALELAIWVGWAEVHLFHCISSVSAVFLWCHIGKEDIQWCCFDEA